MENAVQKTHGFTKGNQASVGYGRPAGSSNKVPRQVKAVIEDAVKQIGGSQRMVDWAMRSNENETIFWRDIVPRVLPKVIQGDPNNPIPFQLVERRIVHVQQIDEEGEG